MSDGYNGPGQESFESALGRHIDIRFNIMRWTSRAAHNLAAWEREGGVKDDILEGYDLARLDPEQRVSKVAQRNRVASWMGVASVDGKGQWSFAETFDKTDDPKGAGGHRLGSMPSLGIAKTDGYRSGKGGILKPEDNPFAAHTKESEGWLIGYDLGVEDRPTKKAKANGHDTAEPPPKKKRGRKPKAPLDADLQMDTPAAIS